MRELIGRLHVEGLTDEESRVLPIRLDAQRLSRMEMSTWRTDAGDLDVFRDIPAVDGARRRYGYLFATGAGSDRGAGPGTGGVA